MSDEKFRDSAEREIFAAAMEARNRQCPWDSPDEVASRAWAMVLEYRSRCPANNRGPTGEAVAEAWEWLETSVGREWASADEVAADGGPTQADLRGEVSHEEHDMIDDAARRICGSDMFDTVIGNSLEDRLQNALSKLRQYRCDSGSANHLPAILFDRKAHRLSKLMLLLQGERFDNSTVRETVDDILKSTAAMNRFALDLSDGR